MNGIINLSANNMNENYNGTGQNNTPADLSWPINKVKYY